jgi:hypothetical protein
MTPYPGVAQQRRRLWRDRRVVAAAAAGMIAIGITATVVTRNVLAAREQARQERLLAQAAANKPPAPSIMLTAPAPRAAQIQTKSGATAAARTADSASPSSGKPAASAVSSDLQKPIEELKVAIESGLPSKMQEVYKAYEQDQQTNKYFKQILDHTESIHVKPIDYQRANVSGNMAEVRYRMIVSVTSNASKTPIDVGPSTWRAELVREGSRAPWKLQKLIPIKL